jgi:hypothetical protein
LRAFGIQLRPGAAGEEIGLAARFGAPTEKKLVLD